MIFNTTTPLCDYYLVYGIFNSNILDLPLNKYQLIDLNKSTSIFKKQFTLKYNDTEFATLLSEPHSSILNKNGGMIKISNHILYNSNADEIINEIYNVLDFTFVRYSRIDLCIDFCFFLDHIHPLQLIDRYLKSEYQYKNKSKVKLIGTNNKTIDFEYLKFGSNYSEICTYMYNKSLEMKQKTHKDWIYKRWKDHNLYDLDNVWRLEFSIKPSQKIYVSGDDGSVINLNSCSLFSPSILSALFVSLLNKYFTFTYFTSYKYGSRELKREHKLKLLDIKSEIDYLILSPENQEGTKRNKLLIDRLYKLHNEMKTNKNLKTMFDYGIFHQLASDLGLSEYCKLKGYNQV